MRLEEHSDELIEVLTLENGKLAPQAGLEVTLGGPKLRYAAGLALSDTGRAAETKPGSFSMVLKEPSGVVGVIVPWNSPVILAIRSLAPALAAGCTAVVKMPAQTALVADAFMQVLSEVSALPRGVVNVFVESKDEGAKLLVSSPEVNVISYTGSTAVGRAIVAAGAPTLKRMSLELGGKTPMVVFDDARVEAAIPAMTAGITVLAGQFCMTGSRILVQRGVADQVREGLAAALEEVRVGPASDPESQMGPLIDSDNVERIDRIVEEAAGYGRIIVRGGPAGGELADGAFYRPSLDRGRRGTDRAGGGLRSGGDARGVRLRGGGNRARQRDRFRPRRQRLDPRCRSSAASVAPDPGRDRMDQLLGHGRRPVRGRRLQAERSRAAQRPSRPRGVPGVQALRPRRGAHLEARGTGGRRRFMVESGHRWPPHTRARTQPIDPTPPRSDFRRKRARQRRVERSNASTAVGGIRLGPASRDRFGRRAGLPPLCPADPVGLCEPSDGESTIDSGIVPN
jgi:Aldehyde dehydrogenase family